MSFMNTLVCLHTSQTLNFTLVNQELLKQYLFNPLFTILAAICGAGHRQNVYLNGKCG